MPLSGEFDYQIDKSAGDSAEGNPAQMGCESVEIDRCADLYLK